MPRLLIVRTGAMGDVLHALPAVAALRHTPAPGPLVPGTDGGGAEWSIDWVIDQRWAALLQANSTPGPVVDAVLPVALRDWKQSPLSLRTLRSLFAFRRLRGRYDLVVDMQGTLRSALIGWLAGGRRLSGYADPRESLARLFYRRQLPRQGTHVVDQGAALLAATTGIALRPCPAAIPREAWAEAWASELISELTSGLAPGGKLCVLAPGAGWGAKRWPAERFGQLAIQLHALGFTCVVNATRQDDPLAAQVVAAGHNTAQAVVCNVTGLIALVRRASLLIGGDSGPLHLAAALGVPVVALFGPTDPARNGPWGPGPSIVLRDPASPRSYKRSQQLDPGLARITVAQVTAAAQSLV